MLAVLRSAYEQQKDKGQFNQRLFDAAYFARPQLEAVFNAVLIRTDPDHYYERYVRSGWFSDVQRYVFERARIESRPGSHEFIARSEIAITKNQKVLGITNEEREDAFAMATQRKYKSILSSDKSRLFKPLPTPGQVYSGGELRKTKYGPLTDYLYWQWKFACDAIHYGFRAMQTRRLLSGESVTLFDERLSDQEYIEHEVVYRSTITLSFLALTIMMTIAVNEYPDEQVWQLRVLGAWDTMRRVSPESEIVWEIWAKDLLLALGK